MKNRIVKKDYHQWKVSFFGYNNSINTVYPFAKTKEEAIKEGQRISGRQELATEPYIIN